MRRHPSVRYAGLIRSADPTERQTMSQRLIRKNLFLGYKHGVPVYRIEGAQPEGEGEGTEGSEGTEGGDSGDTEGNEGEGEGTGKPAEGETVSKEEYERLKARMSAADKSAAEALKKVKEYEDKDKSETERLTGQVEELTNANTELVEQNKRLQFDNAFALQSKHSWQDPEIVLGLVRGHEAVTVEDDGTIKGMDKALDAIAKAKPFLLKESGDGEGASGSSGSTGPTGSPTGSTKKNDPSKIDADALRRKYPALQT